MGDEQAKALIFLREVGAIDNAAYRNLNHVDTLIASKQLGQLKDWGLVEAKGSGKATYYVPTTRLFQGGFTPDDATETQGSESRTQGFPPETQGSGSETQGSSSATQGTGELDGTMSAHLRDLLATIGPHPRGPKLRQAVLALCVSRPHSPAELAAILHLKDTNHLVRTHLTPMREEGLLAYTVPAMPSHPNQKYQATERGKEEVDKWVRQTGLDL